MPGPLQVPRTVYVNAGGKDTNDGISPTSPWKTLDRMWADRENYGELQAPYRCLLQGLGPFTLPDMGPSVAGVGGNFAIIGDPSVDELLFSGTFTGPISGYAVPTSAGLGVDTYAGDFIYITSGALAGVRAQIAENADTSVTIAFKRAWQGGDTANGNTFQIRRPRTEISCAFRTGPNGWVGAVSGLLGCPRHVIAGVRLTGDELDISEASVALAGVRAECGVVPNDSVVRGGFDTPAILGAAECSGWGFQSLNSWFSAGTKVHMFAAYIAGLFTSGTGGGIDYVCLAGARVDTQMFVSGASKLEAFGSGFVSLKQGIYVDANTAGVFTLVDQILNFIVDAFDCVRARGGAMAALDVTSFPFGGAFQGGTSDAAGLGCNADGGGRINWTHQTPTLTGGTPGNDIAADAAVPHPNSDLAADGDGIADALTLSVVARTAPQF